MMREPSTSELVAYMCDIQPELDERTALAILNLETTIRDWIALHWSQQRTIAESLLNLHLEIGERAA
jgi:hypothetical protein